MSYLVMSVKEAVNSVSAGVNGWFLPPVQRPYVWGSRYESEKYICKLFDSIVRGYPIGGLIIWNNEEKMPFREFLRDFRANTTPEFAEKGLWTRKDKWLVYDGQQRLQTLYSCLKYSINNRVLTYDILYDLEAEREDPDETGFCFADRNEELKPHYVRMNEVFSRAEGDKAKFRKALIAEIPDLEDGHRDLIESNVDLLWDVFVKTEKKTIAYFPVKSNNESKVNDIFQRLNTGGVPLSQSDLLMSRIKERKFDFEESLQLFSKKIFTVTQNGYVFESEQILQVLNLFVRGGIRIDPNKTQNAELDSYISEWVVLQPAMQDFFSNFLWESFRINNRSIVPRQAALFPLIVFFKIAHEKGIRFRKFSNTILMDLKKFFILSQMNDWNLQTIVDRFSRRIIEVNEESKDLVFPLDYFVDYFKANKQRNFVLYESTVVDYVWFSLKISMPHRAFLFEPDSRGRFNPEIDHIFPQNLQDQTDEYYESVDILWNMQPVKGEVNNYKRRRHPKEFFSSDDGSKYFTEYDFVEDLKSTEWDLWNKFIKNRRKRILEGFVTMYDLPVKKD